MAEICGIGGTDRLTIRVAKRSASLGTAIGQAMTTAATR